MKRRTSIRDDEWLATVLADTNTLLIDHAHCEKKAAASALHLIGRYSQFPDLVSELTELALEELGHFQEVHQHIVARGLVLGPDEGDPYVQALMKQCRKDTWQHRLIDRLLVSGLIEARSHERLRLLGKHHPDDTLREMFGRFGKAEARHGHLFVALARPHGAPGTVDARLEELETFESDLVDNAPVRCAMH